MAGNGGINMFLFGRKDRSGEVAKDRLRIVLMQDRLSLSPRTLEQMKDEVIMAISRYVEIDPNGIEFEWKGTDRNKALVANIPILSVKRGATRDGRASERTY